MTRTIRMLGMMLAVGACAFATTPAFAGPVPLPAGSSGVAVPQTDTFAGDVGSGYTVLDAYSNTLSNGTADVTLYVNVIKTSGGTLDLAYQVTNNSSTATIDSMSLSDYSNVGGVAVAGLSDMSAPAGTNFVSPTSPANPPNTASRTATPGATISFTFSSSTLGDILPGQSSGLVLVVTNSTSYDTKGAALVASLSTDAGAVGFNGVPEVVAASVPEPSSLVLGSLALIAAPARIASVGRAGSEPRRPGFGIPPIADGFRHADGARRPRLRLVTKRGRSGQQRCPFA